MTALVVLTKRLWFYPKVMAFIIYTMTFNAFQSSSPLADCAFEPVIWCVDRFAGWLGRVRHLFCKTLTFEIT